MDYTFFKIIESDLKGTTAKKVNEKGFLQTENLPKGIHSWISVSIILIYLLTSFSGLFIIIAMISENILFIFLLLAYVFATIVIFEILMDFFHKKEIEKKVNISASTINYLILENDYDTLQVLQEKFPLAYNYIYSESNKYSSEFTTIKIK